MITPEQLIYDLQKENAKLLAELEQAQKDILDFEEYAKVWKKGYSEMETKYKVELANVKQIIAELESELEELETIKLENRR